MTKRKPREFWITKHFDSMNDGLSIGVYHVAHTSLVDAKCVNVRGREIIKVVEVLPTKRRKR